MLELKNILSLTLIPSLLFAQTTIWDGTTDTDWYTNAPSTATTYTLNTAEDLAGLAQLVNNGNTFSNKIVTLGADIFLNDTANWQNWAETPPSNTWTPIKGTTINHFKGTFDGKGHTINGMYLITTEQSQGLFGYFGGNRIMNLGVNAFYVEGTANYTGGVIGEVRTSTTMINVWTNGNVVGTSCVGGFAGNVYDNSNVTITISNSYALGSVTGNSIVGGFVGGVSNIAINNSYSAVQLSGTSMSAFAGSAILNGINNSYYDSELAGKTNNYGLPTSEMQSEEIVHYLNTNAVISGLSPAFEWEYTPGGYPKLNLSEILPSFGSAADYFESGDGTAQNPYIIKNKLQLKNFAMLVNNGKENFSGKYIALGNNIELNKKIQWQPIGNGSIVGAALSIFQGNFDGRNHAIKGIYINSTASTNQALFGYVNGAKIENVGVEDFSIEGTGYIGALIGNSTGTTSIINNSYAKGTLKGSTSVGGLIGSGSNAKITNSYIEGSVTATGSYVGGLSGTGGNIENSYAIADVFGSNYVGGLIGMSGSVTNSYANGIVEGSGNNLGGLIGASGTATGSYYNKSKHYNQGVGTGLTAVQMTQKASFTGWDFEDIWDINTDRNEGMPCFKWDIPKEEFPPISEPLQATYIEGLTLAGITTLPSGYEWKEPETLLFAGNGQKFIAIYRSSGYAEGEVTVNIAKATGAPTFPAHTASAVFAENLTLTGISLPSGYAWSAPATSVPKAGEQNFAATYANSNYAQTASGTITVNVAKNPNAEPSFPPTDAITVGYENGLTLAGVSLPSGYGWTEPTTSLSVGNGQEFPATHTNPNYEKPSTGNIAVNIAKVAGAPAFPAHTASAVFAENLTLNGISLPSGYAWVAPETSVSGAGEQEFAATYENPNYEQPSASGTITLNVAKNPNAEPSFPPTDAIDAEYENDLTLAGISLPSGYGWTEPTTSLSVGNGQEFPATHTNPNYEKPSNGNIAVNISKNSGQEPSFPSIAITATYEEGLTLGDIALPSGYDWVEPSLPIHAAGSYEPEATYALNYLQSIPGKLALNVSKNPGAEPTFPAISADAVYKSGLTLSEIPLPSGYFWVTPSTPVSSGNGQQFDAEHENPNYALRSKGKITVNASAGDGSVAIQNWVYGETPSTPHTQTSTNGAATLLYTGKTNGGTSYSSTQPPTQAGSYTLTATFAAKGIYEAVVRTANFEIERANGSGIVSIDGWKFGANANGPIVESKTNGTANVHYIYKSANTASYAPQELQPVNPGYYMLIAVFPEASNYSEARDTTYFTISSSTATELTVAWSSDTLFTYNKMVQYPIPSVSHNGTAIALTLLNAQSEVGKYNGILKARAVIEDEAVARDFVLKNNTKSYEIVQKPLQPRFSVKTPSDVFDATADTIWVPSDIFSDADLLQSTLAGIIDYAGFARDTVKNESDDASVLSGAPRVELSYAEAGSKSALYRRVETTRKATAIIVTEDVNAKNYSIPNREIVVMEAISEADNAPQIFCKKNASCASMSESSCGIIGGEAVPTCTIFCVVDNACAPMPIGSCAAMGGKAVETCPKDDPQEPIRKPQRSSGSLALWQTASGVVNVDLGYMPAAPATLQIYDLKGKLLASEQVSTRYASIRVNVPSGVNLFRCPTAGNIIMRLSPQ
jgi:hypothetical protein